MKILDALGVVNAELAEDARAHSFEPSVGRENEGDYRPSSMQAGERSRLPILPFFSVLLLGQDGGFRALQSVAGRELQGHPAVGYARTIYLAIALNFVIDWVGLAYLFHTYLSSFPAGISFGAPLVLGLVLAAGFSAFAVSLVKKPLGGKKVRTPSKREAGLRAIAGFVFAAALVGTFVYEGDTAFPSELLVAMATLGLVGLGGSAMIASFGVMDTIYVLIRAVVMVTVGYLVATPLHEAMFEKEIRSTFCAGKVKSISNKLEERTNAWTSQRPELVSRCESRSAEEAGDCKEIESRVACLQAEKRAHEALYSAECAGVPVGDELRKQTRALVDLHGCDTAALVILAEPTSNKRWCGQKAKQHLAEANALKERTKSLESEKKSCLEQRKRAQENRRTQNYQCQSSEEIRQFDAEYAREERKLKAQRASFQWNPGPLDPEQPDAEDEGEGHAQASGAARNCGEQAIGAIEQAIAMQQIVDGVSDSTGEGDEAVAAADRRRIVRQKLIAAWILALVMPLIVVTMKLTGGKRLEQYLKHRWSGK